MIVKPTTQDVLIYKATHDCGLLEAKRGELPDSQVERRIEKWTNEEIDRRVNDRLKRALESH